MGRYVYSLVRCVPDPRTGEFVTVGAIAGDTSTGDWSIRQIQNERRVRKLAGANELGIVHNFMARIGQTFDAQAELWDGVDGTGEALTEEWLWSLHHDLRNVVQLTPPLPIASDSAEMALDFVFRSMILDPVSRERTYVSRQKLFHGLLRAYDQFLPHGLVRQHADLYVGNHLHTKMDFAIGQTATYQLAQTWSFQVEEIGLASTQVKAWGYALRSLREGEEARIVSADGTVSEIESKDVNLQILVAPPETSAQSAVYEEAKEIFEDIGGEIRTLDDVAAIAERAQGLASISG